MSTQCLRYREYHLDRRVHHRDGKTGQRSTSGSHGPGGYDRLHCRRYTVQPGTRTTWTCHDGWGVTLAHNGRDHTTASRRANLRAPRRHWPSLPAGQPAEKEAAQPREVDLPASAPWCRYTPASARQTGPSSGHGWVHLVRRSREPRPRQKSWRPPGKISWGRESRRPRRRLGSSSADGRPHSRMLRGQ